MSATPSTRICAFCTRLVLLSRDKKTVTKHINVKGTCGGSGKTAEEHDRVAKALSMSGLQTAGTPVPRQSVLGTTSKTRASVPRKRSSNP